MKKIHSILINSLAGLTLLLGSAIDSHAAPITLVDQQNLASVAGTNGGVSFGQSFTPSLPAIDAIEFLMAGFGDTVVVRLLDRLAGSDGLGGALIASSNPVVVSTPGLQQNIHFDFPARVALSPSHTYVAELFTPGGIEGVSWSADTYGGGQFLHEGVAADSFPQGRDLIFTEGLTHPISEPGTEWVFALGLLGLTLQRGSRRTTVIR